MAGEKRGAGRRSPGTSGGQNTDPAVPDRQNGPGIKTLSGDDSPAAVFFRNHALSFIVFFLSLFFIITITNPALYTNDEWITANQLHQLDIGHQVTFSEGKYGVTQNGTVSAYFTYRQNVLMYSLALPVAALPVVKMFSLLSDNFRLIVILLWSLCLILPAFLLEARNPAYSRIRGVRILFPALLFALFLFMGNILLYKQFPFSPPDAPFEVAALVLTNQIFFALTITILFEILREILDNTWMALFGALACISSSSFIFWAGTGKDHMLTALVFSFIIYWYIRYLLHRKWQDALPAFVFSGLLIWIRPEIGFFVMLIMGLFFCIPLARTLFTRKASLWQVLFSVLPAAGVFLGGIPFFINNIIVSHNWLIPAFDLPRGLEQSGGTTTIPLPLEKVVTDPTVVNQTTGMTLSETVSRVVEIILHTMFGGFTVDNLVRGFFGVMTFPANNSIGFLIMCPLIVVGIFLLLLWHRRVLEGSERRKEVVLFLFLMISAVFISYLTQFGSMNTSLGILPDMRYLSPAYIPCGLLSIVVLSRMPFFKQPKEYLVHFLSGSVLVIPVLFFLMVFVHPFGSQYEGYAALFKFTILAELVFCLCLMIISRWYYEKFRIVSVLLPYVIVLLLLTVFSFQFMLTVLYGMVMKMNGYPFWIPLVREGVNLFVVIQYVPPV